MEKSVDELIASVARLFQTELAKLHARSDWSSWKDIRLDLEVTYSPDKSTFKLVFHEGYSLSVEGSSLGRLMDEASHRLDFDDREKGRIETSLQVLPAPKVEGEDEISF